MKRCADTTCKRRDQVLPFTEFYRDTSRKDGYSNRCKPCRARQAREERQAKRIVARKPSVKVYLAVQQGFRTREQIEAETGLHEDQVADSLALLCFVKKTVRIKRVGESKYFVPVAIAA